MNIQIETTKTRNTLAVRIGYFTKEAVSIAEIRYKHLPNGKVQVVEDVKMLG